MRNTLNIILILIFAIQCKDVEEHVSQQTDWEQTKSSREYFDYAIFIQNNPHSEYIFEAMKKYLILQDSASEFIGGSRFNAKIDRIDTSKVLFNGYIKDIDSLRYIGLNYLKNANGNAQVASKLKYKVQIPETQIFDSISKGSFEFQFYEDPFATKALQKIIIELSHAIEDYKEFLSDKWYDRPYSKLSSKKKSGIDKLVHHRFVFFDFKVIENSRLQPFENILNTEIDGESN